MAIRKLTCTEGQSFCMISSRPVPHDHYVDLDDAEEPVVLGAHPTDPASAAFAQHLGAQLQAVEKKKSRELARVIFTAAALQAIISMSDDRSGDVDQATSSAVQIGKLMEKKFFNDPEP